MNEADAKKLGDHAKQEPWVNLCELSLAEQATVVGLGLLESANYEWGRAQIRSRRQQDKQRIEFELTIEHPANSKPVIFPLQGASVAASILAMEAGESQSMTAFLIARTPEALTLVASFNDSLLSVFETAEIDATTGKGLGRPPKGI